MSKKIKVKKKSRHSLSMIVFLGLIVLYFFLGFNQALKVVHYNLTEQKLVDPLKLVLITDLHSCRYGEKETELIHAINQEDPDLVLLGGDIIDDEIPDTYAMDLIRVIGIEYPTYYVSGNHEIWTHNLDVIKAKLRQAGVNVLDGVCETITIRGQEIDLAGVDDPSIGNALYEQQIDECRKEIKSSHFCIFLTHRPERVDTYLNNGFDFILAGHAHGGQWRFPPFCNGVYAPTQGWWPRYVGGYYKIGKGEMIVSRGLARETNMLPRFYDRPELVVVNLKPD